MHPPEDLVQEVATQLSRALNTLNANQTLAKRVIGFSEEADSVAAFAKGTLVANGSLCNIWEVQ